MEKFTKADLKTWDIIEMRNGDLGLVCMKDERIILQNGGSEMLDDYSDELTDEMDYDEKFDIMRVYRDRFGNAIDFIDYCEADMVFDRDSSWVRPSEKERAEAKVKAREEQRKYQEQREKEWQLEMANRITVLTQGYYGNRTLLTAKKEEIDSQMFGFDYLNVDNDKTYIFLSDNVAVVYSKKEEEEYRKRIVNIYKKELSELKPLCVIPKKNITIYNHCFLCRVDDNGEYVDLQNGDIDLVKDYFAW